MQTYETILATNQEIFFCKSSLRTKHNWHYATGFLIYTAPLNVYFYYITIYFFVKNFFFGCWYFSDYDTQMLFVFWLRPFITFVLNWESGEGGVSSKMCTGAYRGRGISRLLCTYALTISLFTFLFYGVLFYL